ncbi:hypothetical protein AOB58_779 [Staphylococcus sp. AntiMn-1]|uniref:DUF3310 domain-containing protein n=1 Tax=Staphylococcus sp. AntiMn-1 TaxID=1715860 RepID=UPI0007F0B530|nr:DUF3310 domain-containing protein [Staphylococcus sp. AntiMn-1]ANK37581.1 hypothetical protein AOB58_779 [Staphylococcus sp. AntiMn-1]
MKIRELDLDQYVIVYDIGKSENHKGMTVVGRVEEIVFNDDGENAATINSLGNLYDITDDNYFDLWTKSIEDKTEHIGFDKENTEKSRKLLSNDVQQRKRKNEDTALFKIKDLKVGYKVKVLGDNMIGEVSEIADNGKSAEIKVDDGVYRVIIDNYDFTIIEWNAVPEYAEDTVNHPSHYNYGDIEVINFIEQVTQHYNANVAYHIGNAIKYLARSPHKNGKEDVAKAKWYIERAYEKWDVK